MASRATTAVILLVAVLLIGSSCVFTIGQAEHAIRVQFGDIVEQYDTPGLKFKWPAPIDRVRKFERRILTQSYNSETFLTNENRALIVDFYVNWRIKDPSRYFESTTGDEEVASQRLADIVKDGIKNVVAQRTLPEIVTSERAAVTGDMFGRASKSADKFGIELIDVRVQRIDLPDDVAARVYESMKQGFDRLAKQLRGEGEKESQRIKAEADRHRTEILSAANRDALNIRGSADAQATEIYAAAFNRDPEFYAFYRSLQAYQKSLGKDEDVLVVTPDGEFFKYLKSSASRR
ncbi:MAG: protease modulator HflC [Steroidobacteraceae bacterium]